MICIQTKKLKLLFLNNLALFTPVRSFAACHINQWRYNFYTQKKTKSRSTFSLTCSTVLLLFFSSLRPYIWRRSLINNPNVSIAQYCVISVAVCYIYLLFKLFLLQKFSVIFRLQFMNRVGEIFCYLFTMCKFASFL